MHPRQRSGLTLVEALVILGILVALALVTPHCGQTRALVRGQMTQTLSNMKQLHLATQSMELDGTTMPDTNCGWPGDTGGTFTNWVRLIVPDYLSTIVRDKAIPAMKDSAILVYSVGETNSGETVLFTTANFTNTPEGGSPLDRRAKPYGDTGFVVFRKAGDGAILLPRQVGQTNVIGSFVPLCR